MKELMMRFVREEEGQDLIEYTLLLAFVCLASAALFINAGTTMANIWGIANNATLANAAEGRVQLNPRGFITGGAGMHRPISGFKGMQKGISIHEIRFDPFRPRRGRPRSNRIYSFAGVRVPGFGGVVHQCRYDHG